VDHRRDDTVHWISVQHAPIRVPVLDEVRTCPTEI
jgi:hypothetical protein